MKFVYRHILFISFTLFLLLNISLYLFIYFFHAAIPFSTFDYTYNANHYKQDSRMVHKKFSFINALGQYDAQWYLKIAEQGYPNHPDKLSVTKKMTGGLNYNFFPLLPVLIACVNVITKNIELSGFLVSNSILIAIFFSLYFVISRWFSRKVAVKTIFLLFLFPFSIFLRSYYTEGLRLLLFIWFCFGIQERKFTIAAVSVGLLTITSGITLFLLPYFLILLYILRKAYALSSKKLLYLGIIAISPLFLWMLFCFLQTQNPVYFVTTRFAWYRPAFPLLHNIMLLFLLPWLPLRSFYGSQIDVLFILIMIVVACLSRKILPPFVWLTTLVLAFTPLIVQDSISFARFTSVLFPFFAYLGYVLKRKYYMFFLLTATIGLLGVSLLFINWYWIE
ncbi:MAG TPA: hypothetical protein VLG12_00075 [Candidatus Saccharimonadales bacterium]|nr:hypothetical protein [Candidatus Saccharimonadales bacterium]